MEPTKQCEEFIKRVCPVICGNVNVNTYRVDQCVSGSDVTNCYYINLTIQINLNVRNKIKKHVVKDKKLI